MRPPVPWDPARQPFISFYTPTFMRPAGLARLLESVSKQTAREEIEHLVVPDHVGYGIGGGLFGRIPTYAETLRGRYVHVVCDDDVLAHERAVEQLKAFAEKHDEPPVIIVRVTKGGIEYPFCDPADPVAGQIDMCCYVLRRDVWLAHQRDYGLRYEGDFDHGRALALAGWPMAVSHIDFVEGGASMGRPEVDWR